MARSSPTGESPRGRSLHETVGRYNAQTEPSTIVLNEERIRHWLERGAQPTDPVRKLLKTAGHPAHRTVGRGPPPCGAAEFLARVVDTPDRVRVEEFEEDDGTLSVLELPWPTTTSQCRPRRPDRRRCGRWSRPRR